MYSKAKRIYWAFQNLFGCLGTAWSDQIITLFSTTWKRQAGCSELVSPWYYLSNLVHSLLCSVVNRDL